MKRIIASSLLFLALSANANRLENPTSEGYFGVTGELYALTWAGKPILDSLAQCMANAGVCWDREVLPWYRVQARDSASFDWSEFDKVVAATAARGIRVLPILSCTPSWASTRADTPSLSAPPCNLSRPIDSGNFWGRFVYEAIKHYGPCGTFWVAHPDFDSSRLAVRYWEVWNEPNSVTDGWVTPDPDHGYAVPRTPFDTIARQESLYARLCDVAVEAATLTGTDARLLVGVLWRALDSLPNAYSNVRKVKGVEWLDAYYRCRRQNATGGVSVHPYQNGAGAGALDAGAFARDLDTIRRVMQAHGEADKPLWATELSWSLDRGPGAKERAVLSLPGAFALGLSGTPVNFYDKMFWYNFCITGQGNGASLMDFQFRNLKDWTITPQPCFYAFRQMTNEFSGKRPNGRVLSGDSMTDSRTFLFEFEDSSSGARTWLGWRSYEVGAEPVLVRVPARTDQLDIAPLARSANADRFNRTLAVGTDGWLALALDTIPVYIHEIGNPARSDLVVDSVWAAENADKTVTLFARVKNTGNRQFASSGKKGSVLRFAIDGAPINPVAEPNGLAPGGIAIIRSSPLSLDRSVAHLVSASANPDKEAMELNFDNNVRYCPLPAH